MAKEDDIEERISTKVRQLLVELIDCTYDDLSKTERATLIEAALEEGEGTIIDVANGVIALADIDDDDGGDEDGEEETDPDGKTDDVIDAEIIDIGDKRRRKGR